jgi:hypothetical protein
VRQGAEVLLHTFDRDLKVPPGVRKLDARRFAEPEEILSYTQAGKKGAIAAFSNFFRYRVLAEAPGWWFDTDVFCLKDAEAFHELERRSQGLLAGRQDALIINNAAMFIRDVQVAREMGARAVQKAKEYHNSFPWGTLGPQLVTDYIADNPERAVLLPSEAFYPLTYHEVKSLFHPDQAQACRAKSESSYTVHLWNEIIRRHHLPKVLGPCHGSFLEALFDSVPAVGLRPAGLPVDTLEALMRSVKPAGWRGWRAYAMLRKVAKRFPALRRFQRFRESKSD